MTTVGRDRYEEAPAAVEYQREVRSGGRLLTQAFPGFLRRAQVRRPGAGPGIVAASACSLILQTMEDNAVAVLEGTLRAHGWTPLAAAGDAVFALPPGGIPVPDPEAERLSRAAAAYPHADRLVPSMAKRMKECVIRKGAMIGK